MTDQSLAAQVTERKTRSLEWLDANLYGQLQSVYKHYLCEADPNADPNDPSKIDYSQTALAMPDTYGWVQRQTARITAQIPNIRFRSDNPQQAELISRTLMYQWDRSRMQRGQKRHVRQATLFGWSVKAWSWMEEKFRRRKRVDLFDQTMTPEALAAIAEMYLPQIAQIVAPAGIQVGSLEDAIGVLAHPAAGMKVRAELLAVAGRGSLLPVEYDYRGYCGPHCDVLFVGDCYPEPNFQSIQESNWFIVERRRNRQWLENAAKAYPELADGIKKLLEAHPGGTAFRSSGSLSQSSLRDDLMTAVGFTQTTTTTGIRGDTGLWTVTEMHTPGRDAKITYVADQTQMLGTIQYPYDLDGWMAFTELVLIDNLLCGWGDSTARVLRGVQELHNQMVSQRADLVDAVTNPLIFTGDRNLYENPEQIKRRGRMRLVFARGGSNAILWENNGPAAAAVVTSLNDETPLMRMFQVGTGDSNMSMAANVDPNQNRTATGARLSAFNQDILTKDAVDMFSMALADDAEMMFRLNRSEMNDAVEFEADKYNRTYSSIEDPFKGAWAKVEPGLFQRDGHITVEVGSTLADDDEAKVQKAKQMFSMFNGHPMVNQQRLLTEVIKPFVRTGDVGEFMAPPPQPEPPEDNTKVNISLSIKYEELDPAAQQMLLAKALNGAALSPGPPPSPGPSGPPLPRGAAPPSPPAPEGHPGMMATEAAMGEAPPIV